MAVRGSAQDASKRRWVRPVVASLAAIAFVAALLAWWPMSGTADPVVAVILLGMWAVWRAVRRVIPAP